MKAETFQPSYGPTLKEIANALLSLNERIDSIIDTRCVTFGRPDGTPPIEVIPEVIYRNKRDRGGVHLTLVGREPVFWNIVTVKYKGGQWVSLKVRGQKTERN